MIVKPKEKIMNYQELNGWDGYSRKGEAIYDAIFEQEKNEMIVRGLECKCGLPKFEEDEYCQGDYCAIEG